MRMPPGFQETLCNLAAILLLLSPTVTESVAELQSRFDRETDSVRKAKILVRLGDAQFEEARRAGKEGDDNTPTTIRMVTANWRYICATEFARWKIPCWLLLHPTSLRSRLSARI